MGRVAARELVAAEPRMQRPGAAGLRLADEVDLLVATATQRPGESKFGGARVST
jgi:hypothetical protein